MIGFIFLVTVFSSVRSIHRCCMIRSGSMVGQVDGIQCLGCQNMLHGAPFCRKWQGCWLLGRSPELFYCFQHQRDCIEQSHEGCGTSFPDTDLLLRIGNQDVLYPMAMRQCCRLPKDELLWGASLEIYLPSKMASAHTEFCFALSTQERLFPTPFQAKLAGVGRL